MPCDNLPHIPSNLGSFPRLDHPPGGVSSGQTMHTKRGASADHLDSKRKRILSYGYHRGRMIECVLNPPKLLDSKSSGE